MNKTVEELNECPSCHAKSATTKKDAVGAVFFYCTKDGCDFELQQEKQDMEAARGKLEDIKSQLFGAKKDY
jgi:hypothetical protein